MKLPKPQLARNAPLRPWFGRIALLYRTTVQLQLHMYFSRYRTVSYRTVHFRPACQRPRASMYMHPLKPLSKYGRSGQ